MIENQISYHMLASYMFSEILISFFHFVVFKKYNADNIVVADKNWLNEIENLNSKLIVIDRADIVLTEEIKECIKNDCSNVYLLFIRGPIGLNISPNYYAHLVREDNTIRLEYEFNVGRWF